MVENLFFKIFVLLIYIKPIGMVGLISSKTKYLSREAEGLVL